MEGDEILYDVTVGVMDEGVQREVIVERLDKSQCDQLERVFKLLGRDCGMIMWPRNSAVN
jgi:hypothetical protein